MSQTRESVAECPIRVLRTAAQHALERRSAMGAKLFPHRHRRGFFTGAPARAPALNFKGSRTWLFSAITALVLIVPTTTIAAEAQTNRMVVEYVPPTNPAHQALYQRLMERRVLEKVAGSIQPILSSYGD